jgi:hypothetical protein
MQMYFFMFGKAYWFNTLIAASAVFSPRQQSFVAGQMARGED